MRGRLALAGIRPDDTPVGDYIDAEWAALCDLVGTGEHLTELWAELTGETVAAGGGAPVDDPERRGDQATVDTVRDLDDEQRARWVPAYRKALQLAETDPDAADAILEELDRHWEHTASFAGGQQALVNQFGEASGAPTRPASKPTRATASPAAEGGASAPLPAAPVFGMPAGMEG